MEAHHFSGAGLVCQRVTMGLAWSEAGVNGVTSGQGRPPGLSGRPFSRKKPHARPISPRSRLQQRERPSVRAPASIADPSLRWGMASGRVGSRSAIHGRSGSTPQSTRRGIRRTALDHLRAGIMSTPRQVTRDDLRSPIPEHLFYIFPTARLGFSRPQAVTADFFNVNSHCRLPLGRQNILYN